MNYINTISEPPAPPCPPPPDPPEPPFPPLDALCFVPPSVEHNTVPNLVTEDWEPVLIVDDIGAAPPAPITILRDCPADTAILFTVLVYPEQPPFWYPDEVPVYSWPQQLPPTQNMFIWPHSDDIDTVVDNVYVPVHGAKKLKV